MEFDLLVFGIFYAIFRLIGFVIGIAWALIAFLFEAILNSMGGRGS
jgi:hypothetical protein